MESNSPNKRIKLEESSKIEERMKCCSLIDKSEEDDINHKYDDEFKNESTISFNPPVYIQRYQKVSELLEKLIRESKIDSPISIIEFGCAELKMNRFLKDISPFLQKLVFVDKDTSLLQLAKRSVRPLPYEHLKKRETPLVVEIYSGCGTLSDPRILTTSPKLFSVIGIEIVEHLDPHILNGFIKNVFGLLSPPFVIFTTPNSDFNVVFNLEVGKFRHWDHRFEWSRSEFVLWCESIIEEYPCYEFEICGIGNGTEEQTQKYGSVSQMSVFRKIKETDNFEQMAKYCNLVVPGCYDLVEREEYPFQIDTSTRDEKIVDAYSSYINNYVFSYSNVENYTFDEVNEIQLPLHSTLFISGLPDDVQLPEVIGALEKGGFILKKNIEGVVELILKVPEFSDYQWPDTESENEEQNSTPAQNIQTTPYVEDDWD